MIWFPELFTRFEEYENEHPGESATVCEVSSVVISNNTDCGSEALNDNVYLHTLIIGLACIPTSFWLPLCVHRLGAKFFLGKFYQQNVGPTYTCNYLRIVCLNNLILNNNIYK